MRAILTLAVKDLRLLFRDKFGVFWIFAFPMMYAGFFGVIFGSSDDDNRRGRLSLAIVDEDGGDGAKSLIDRLAAHDSINIDRPEGDPDGVVVRSLEEAQGEVRRGRKIAYLLIPKGYGDDPFAMFHPQDDGTPQLQIGIDPSRKAEAGFLQGIMMENLFSGMSNMFTDKDGFRKQLGRAREQIAQTDDLSIAQKAVLGTFMKALDSFVDQADFGDVISDGDGDGDKKSAGMGFGGQDMIEITEVTREYGNRPSSSFEITFPQAMVWGLMGVAMGFAITIVRERTNGTLQRLRMAPIGRVQLLAGKSLACFASCMMTMAFLLTFGAVALGVRIGDPLLLFLAMAGTAACFTGIMMTASVLGKTEQAVAGAAWGTMMPFAMIGGGMIPLIAMPSWLVSLSDISPIKWAIYSLEGAIWRGFTFSDMIGPVLIMTAIGAAFFVLGVWIYRRGEA